MGLQYNPFCGCPEKVPDLVFKVRKRTPFTLAAQVMHNTGNIVDCAYILSLVLFCSLFSSAHLLPCYLQPASQPIFPGRPSNEDKTEIMLL